MRYVLTACDVLMIGLIAALVGCGGEVTEPGIEVPVVLVFEATPTTWTNDLDQTITLDEAWVVTRAVTLEACTERAALGPLERVLDALTLERTAWAHHTLGSSPLRWASHHAGQLRAGAPETSTRVGEFRPAPGAYCGVTVGLGPGDPDTSGLPATPDLTEAGVYIRGTARPADATDSVAFVIASDFSLDLRREVALEASLDAAQTVEVVFSTEHLLDGVDLSVDDPDGHAQAVLRNLNTRVEVRIR